MNNIEERPVYSYIPKNLNMTGGLLGGAFDTRHLVEGLIGASVGVVLYKVLSIYITAQALLYVCVLIGLALFAAGMIGGNGEPLSIFLFNFINYENRRIFVTLRPPMPDFDKPKEKKTEKGKKKSLAFTLSKKKKEAKA